MIKIDGLKELNKNLDKILQESVNALGNGITEVCQDLADKSAPQCPYDTSKLVRSLKAIVNDKTVAKGLKSRKAQKFKSPKLSKKYVINASVSYDTEYAIKQHEELSFRHPTPGTKAKYLEDPFQENEANYVKMIENAIKEVLK